MRKPTISIIGPGALGSALAIALAKAGYPLAEIVSRNDPASLRRAAAVAKKVHATASTLRNAKFQADIVWLCVPDDALAHVADSISDRDWRNIVMLHASGALPADVLNRIQRRGAATASAHPMMSFVRGGRTDFSGIWFALEGDARAITAARRMVRALGGKTFDIQPEAKPLYHALGAFLSPFLVTLLSAAEQVATRAGISQRDLPSIMRPILTRTLENYFSKGAAPSFSGPLLRGDVTTIRKHVRALKKLPERELYVALVREAARTLPVQRRTEILKLLK